MAYNRINSIARGVGIASLAYALSACGGPDEKELSTDHSILRDARVSDGIYERTDAGVSDAMGVQYPWYVVKCEDLRQALQKTSLSPEERQEQVQRCENECRPPGNEASLRYCADLYCCSGYGTIIFCGEYRDLWKEEYGDSWKDDWKDKEFPDSRYLKCMERFGVKPY